MRTSPIGVKGFSVNMQKQKNMFPAGLKIHIYVMFHSTLTQLVLVFISHCKAKHL